MLRLPFVALVLLGGPLAGACLPPVAGDGVVPPDAGLAADRCGDAVCGLAESVSRCPTDCPPTNRVDLLFVVDNSASGQREQELLRARFETLLGALRHGLGDVPDLHVGVVSTDVGAGSFFIAGCEAPAGDGGALLTGWCAQPEGASFLVDGVPRGCALERRPDDSCAAYDCPAGACAEGWLVTDPATGCPRCRNFEGETLTSLFGCLADLGTAGCGFEQPLESLRRALDDHPDNGGFLRPDSVLAVLFVTDEDDCSARPGAAVFDPAETALGSALGPLTGFRCFEQGVTCDVDDRLAVGTRAGCRAREDEGSLLVPVSDYVTFLRQLRDPGRLVVAAVTGPWDGATVTVALDALGQPRLEPVCVSEAGDPALPGVRLSTFLRAFYPSGVPPARALQSVCVPDSFDAVLSHVGGRVAAVLR